MNRCLECHDSSIGELRQNGEDALVLFDEAYVHESKGQPGVDPGTGWTQLTELRIHCCTVSDEPPALPADVWDGWLECGGERYDNLFALPFSFRGTVRLRLELCSGHRIDLQGSGITVVAVGPAEYVEEFSGAG